VAHTEHTGSLDVFKDPGEEFRRFRSKSSIRRHGKGDFLTAALQGYRVSFPAGTTTRRHQQLLPTTENSAWILEPLSIISHAHEERIIRS